MGLKAYSSTLKSHCKAIRMPGEANADDSFEIASRGNSFASVFQLLAILIMPRLWGVDGIWWSTTVAELSAMAITISYLIAKRDTFHY